MPNRDNTPREKAISVAMGMAAPFVPGPSGHIILNMMIGMIIPPNAAMTGRRAFRRLESSPTNSSRLISSPTEKKKMAINASFINDMMVMLEPSIWNRFISPKRSTTSFAKKALYISRRGELAIIMAAKATKRRMAPPLILVFIKCLMGDLKIFLFIGRG